MTFNLFGRFTTRKRFPDGSIIMEVHRYAIRYVIGDRSVDVGFEQAFEPGVDRLIHLGAVRHWNAPHDREVMAVADQNDLVQKLQSYCRDKRLRCRFTDSSSQA
jgi:hypothetical protein